MSNDEFTEDQKRLMQMLNDTPPNTEEYKKEMAAYQDLREEFKKYGIFLNRLSAHVLITLEDAVKILNVLRGYEIILSKDGTTLKLLRKG